MKLSSFIRRKWMRRLFRIGLACITIILVYSILLLPRMMSWGATGEEYKRKRPGDDLILHKDYKNTLALTINAPPSVVWPWVAQMGLHKGGFYSYTSLENLFGCKLKNADTINPEWINPEVGDPEPVCASQEGKPGAGWYIAIVQKDKALVWKGTGSAEWMLGIYIDSIDGNHSRLISRQQFRNPPRWSSAWWLEKLWFEWAHCIMQYGMLRGIKKRAEKMHNQ